MFKYLVVAAILVSACGVEPVVYEVPAKPLTPAIDFAPAVCEAPAKGRHTITEAAILENTCPDNIAQVALYVPGKVPQTTEVATGVRNIIPGGGGTGMLNKALVGESCNEEMYTDGECRYVMHCYTDFRDGNYHYTIVRQVTYDPMAETGSIYAMVMWTNQAVVGEFSCHQEMSIVLSK